MTTHLTRPRPSLSREPNVPLPFRPHPDTPAGTLQRAVDFLRSFRSIPFTDTDLLRTYYKGIWSSRWLTPPARTALVEVMHLGVDAGQEGDVASLSRASWVSAYAVDIHQHGPASSSPLVHFLNRPRIPTAESLMLLPGAGSVNKLGQYLQ